MNTGPAGWQGSVLIMRVLGQDHPEVIPDCARDMKEPLAQECCSLVLPSGNPHKKHGSLSTATRFWVADLLVPVRNAFLPFPISAAVVHSLYPLSFLFIPILCRARSFHFLARILAATSIPNWAERSVPPVWERRAVCWWDGQWSDVEGLAHSTNNTVRYKLGLVLVFWTRTLTLVKK